MSEEIVRTNLDKLIDAVRQAADNDPSYVYQKAGSACWYAKYDEVSDVSKPDCIVGHGLVALGFDPEELVDQHGTVIDNRYEPWFHDFFSRGETQDSYFKKTSWLDHVQYQQDRNSTWKDAVVDADNHFVRT